MADVPYREEDAQIHLTADEAIVLFDLLWRWTKERDKEEPGSGCFESSAECAVLHGLLCDLESHLVAPFRNDYGAILEGARRRLEHRWDYTTLQGKHLREGLTPDH